MDVDNKGGKNGDAQILALELDGYELPASLEQSTPSGGRHIIYATPQPLKQGVNVLGAGLDIRSRGGYIVGPGSLSTASPTNRSTDTLISLLLQAGWLIALALIGAVLLLTVAYWMALMLIEHMIERLRTWRQRRSASKGKQAT